MTSFVPVSLFAAAASVAFWQSSRSAVLWDLTYSLEIAHRIALGEVPYRDFVVPQPPLTFLLQAAVARAAGPGYLWHRVYCAVVAGCTVVMTWRIISLQLGEVSQTRARFLAFLAAAPIVFLNGYAILPLPFYDSDCAFFVLAALLALLEARRRASGWLHVAAGVLVAVPALAKQNTGLAALLLVHGCLFVGAVTRSERAERRAYALFLSGTVLSLVLLAAALHAWAGLPNLYHWTVSYAASRRWPAPRLLLTPYQQTGTWITIAAALAGYLVVRRRGTRWTLPAGLGIIGLPLLVATRTMFRWGLAARSTYLWGLGSVVGGVAAVAAGIKRRWSFESMIPIVAIGVAHAAFASQGVYDSAYSVWPFLTITLAPLAAQLIDAAAARRLAIGFVVLMSVGLTWLGYRHVARQERLGFVDLSGHVETASLAPIRGLAVPGTHISDFERLVRRADEIIPADDGVLFFPGEDPFFVASGRRPRLPIVLFDDTAMPFDRAHLMLLLEERGIDWVIVKDSLQLRNAPWRDMKAFVTSDLPARYELVEAMPRYRILKARRKPAGAVGSLATQ